MLSCVDSLVALRVCLVVLIWVDKFCNAANDYTEGVDYTPKADKEKVEANKKELKEETKKEK